MVEPMYSPWGTVDHCKMLCYGAFEVQTARHGGVMILRELADETFLSAIHCHLSCDSLSIACSSGVNSLC